MAIVNDNELQQPGYWQNRYNVGLPNLPTFQQATEQRLASAKEDIKKIKGKPNAIFSKNKKEVARALGDLSVSNQDIVNDYNTTKDRYYNFQLDFGTPTWEKRNRSIFSGEYPFMIARGRDNIMNHELVKLYSSTGHGYNGFKNIDNWGNVTGIYGPIDLFFGDALPDGFTLESNYNLFPQYDKWISNHGYKNVPTYSIKSAFTTRNSKPFYHFSPNRNPIQFENSIIMTDGKNYKSIDSGADYIDIYEDPRGNIWYRNRDIYKFNPKDFSKKYWFEQAVKPIDAHGNPYVYTTNWNLVNDPLLSEEQREMFQNRMLDSYHKNKKDRDLSIKEGRKGIKTDAEMKYLLKKYLGIDIDSLTHEENMKENELYNQYFQ